MRMKATVAYDGYEYAGWQKQDNALGIQSVIEKALSTIHKEPVSITASGRTDAKVHAYGQVFHFEGIENMNGHQYVQALNTLLDPSIRIVDVVAVSDQFHARFSAIYKRYDYICTFDQDDPFAYRRKHRLFKPLNVENMKEGAQYLLGTHDFTSFCSSKIEPEKPKTKTITNISLIEEGKDLRMVFEGNGFLRYQVRMMAATLIEVGRGKIPPEKVKEILELKHKEACRYNAPAHALYLVEVGYETS